MMIEILSVTNAIIAFLSVTIALYFSYHNKKRVDEKDVVKRIQETEMIKKLISGLATKKDLDEKLEKEMLSLKYDLNDKIDNLKSDMKVQLNELKDDVKSQKEIADDMRADVIQTKESDKHAHVMIDTLNRRIDDIIILIKKERE